MTVKKKTSKKVLSRTTSVCPECLKILKADIFERDGKVWIEKTCPEHGRCEELYWGSSEMYRKAKRFASDGKGIENPNVTKKHPVCPKDCGLCSMHKSHTALANLVVTNRCDLSCWYCLPHDEEIPVRINGNVQIRKIGDIAEHWLSDNKTRFKIGEYSIPEDLEVLSYDKGKCVWRKVKKLLKRRYRGNLLKVTTGTGKSVRVTEDHRFVMLDGNRTVKKKISEKSPDERLLSVDRLPESGGVLREIDIFDGFRKLPHSEMKKVFIKNVGPFLERLMKERGLKNAFADAEIDSGPIYSWKSRGGMPLPEFYKINDYYKNKVNGITFGVDAKKYSIERFLEITPELAKLIGYFVADGHYAKQNIWFTCGDEYVRKEIEDCIQKLGLGYSVIEYGKQKKAPQVVVGNKLMALVFRYVFGIPAGAGKKRLPVQAMQFGSEEKMALLTGLFNGDGYVVRGERHASLGLGTVSHDLARDVTYLLHSVSVSPRIHKMSMENNRLANYDHLLKIYISSKDMVSLADMLDLKPSHKKRLENLTERKKSKIERHEDFIIDELRNVERTGNVDTDVYDLEVDSDSHSFVGGNGVLISNCFFYAKRMGYVYEPTLKEIDDMVKTLVSEKPVACNAVQLTGGEPTLRDDLLDMIGICKKHGIDHVQLNTNDIRISKDLDFLTKVREAGVNTLYLSFDGVSPKTNPKNHWEIPGILDNCRKAGGIGAVLVPTVIKGLNDHEIGDILRFGFRNNDIVRGVNFQPVSLVGKITNADRKKMRITIPDTIQKIEEQTDGQVGKEDFYPVPTPKAVTHFVEALTGKPQYELSSHFACGMATYIFSNKGKMLPITRFVDVEGLLEYVSEKGDALEQGGNRYITGAKLLFRLGSFIDKTKAPSGFSLKKILFNALMKHDYRALGELQHRSLFVGMMHFQDLYNYDIERVKRCCIHYVMSDNRIVPFCAFNVIPQWYRDKDMESQGISFSDWEKKTGNKMHDDMYKRDVKALEGTELYRKTYGK